MLFFINFLFSLVVAIFQIPVVFVLLLFTILNLVLFFVNKKYRDKRMLIIFWIMVLFLSFRYETAIYKDKIQVGEIHRFTLNRSRLSSEIIKIDGKYLNKRVYAKLEEEDLDNGIYEVYGKINGVEDVGAFLYLNINSKDVYIGNFERYKWLFSKNIIKLTKDFPKEFQGFLKAILLGNKDEINGEMKEKFSYTGAAHLIVISGLHIGMIVAICVMIFNTLRTPYQLRYILTFIFLSFYCFSIGFSPSTLRAYIMGSIYLFSKIFYEETDLKKSLCIAFIVSTLINPISLASVSFQLSYMALFSIVFIYPKIKEQFEVNFGYFRNSNNKLFRILMDIVFVSLSIQIGLTPIFLYNFKILPLYSFLVNVVAVPLGSLFIQLSFFALTLSFLNLGKFLMPLVYYVYKVLLLFIDSASKLPFLSVEVYRQIPWLFLVYLYLCLLFFVFCGFKSKKIFLGTFVVGFLFFNLNFYKKVENFEFKKNMYIGNNESILIVNDPLKKRDIWFLKDRGVKNIDILISSIYIDDEFLKIFKVIKNLKLKKGESAVYKNYIFKNSAGEIIIENDNH